MRAWLWHCCCRCRYNEFLAKVKPGGEEALYQERVIEALRRSRDLPAEIGGGSTAMVLCQRQLHQSSTSMEVVVLRGSQSTALLSTSNWNFGLFGPPRIRFSQNGLQLALARGIFYAETKFHWHWL